MKSNTALTRSTCVVVLHPKTAKDPDRAVIHANRDRKLVFTERVAQQVSCTLVESQIISRIVELKLCNLEGIEVLRWISWPICTCASFHFDRRDQQILRHTLLLLD